MIKLKKWIAPLALAGVVTLSGSIVTPVNSYASQDVTQEQTEKEKYFDFIRGELRKYDVPENDINNLIQKLKVGEPWDSINPEMADTATVIKINEHKTKSVFPDGSISLQEISGGIVEEVEVEVEVEVEDPNGFQTYATIGGGSVSSGTGYRTVTGAKVSGSVVIAAASYKVDYTTVQGGYDYISRVYSRNITVPGPGGNYEVETWGIKRSTENLDGKAYISLRFKAQNAAMGASTMYLNTNVGNDKATVSSNM